MARRASNPEWTHVVRRAVNVMLERVSAEHVRVVDLHGGVSGCARRGRDGAELTKMLQKLTKENRPMNMYL